MSGIGVVEAESLDLVTRDSAIEIKLRYEDISDHDMEKEARNLQKRVFYAGINVLRL